MLFPTAQDQEDYFKRAEFLNNCQKSLNIYNWTKTAYTGFKSLFMSSTRLVASPTSTSASVTSITLWDYPKFQGYSVNDGDN